MKTIYRLYILSSFIGFFQFFLWYYCLKILCLIHYIWDLQKDSTCFIWLAAPRVLINYILMCPCGSIWKMAIASFFFREFSQKQNIQQLAIPYDFPEWFSYIQLIITKEFICVIYSTEKVWPVPYMGSLKDHTVHDCYDTFLHLMLLWTTCTQKTAHQFRGMSMQVTACSKCNSKKGQKTLEEANMKLIKTPKVFSVFINNCPTTFAYNGKHWFFFIASSNILVLFCILGTKRVRHTGHTFNKLSTKHAYDEKGDTGRMAPVPRKAFIYREMTSLMTNSHGKSKDHQIDELFHFK